MVVPQVDIIEIVLLYLLKIDPALFSQYYFVEDQLLYLVLIPHVILIFFLVSFSNAIAKDHVGLKSLIAIAGYIFIIAAGWYGTILAPIFVVWWKVLLVVELVYFILGRFIHPMRSGEILRTAQNIGKKQFEKVKDRKNAEKQVEMLEKRINYLKIRRRRSNIRTEINALSQEIVSLEYQKAQIEAMVD